MSPLKKNTFSFTMEYERRKSFFVCCLLLSPHEKKKCYTKRKPIKNHQHDQNNQQCFTFYSFFRDTQPRALVFCSFSKKFHWVKICCCGLIKLLIYHAASRAIPRTFMCKSNELIEEEEKTQSARAFFFCSL